jgi:hypothetical protein
MTIGVAWIRDRFESPELWVASDSRLSGDGYLWDECPKVLPLTRRDAVAAFSGATAQAYPLLLQIRNAVDAYVPARDGRLDFYGLVAHLERVVNAAMSNLATDPQIVGTTLGDAFTTRGDVIVLGGWSRVRAGFVIRALHHEQKPYPVWKFTRIRDRKTFGARKVFKVFGDRHATSLYTHFLRQRLKEVDKYRNERPFDLEPLEVLCTLLDQSRRGRLGRPIDTIGGAPQVVSILPGATATPFAVRWPADSRHTFLLGRRTLDYERLDVPLVEIADGGGLVLKPPGAWDMGPSAPGASPTGLEGLLAKIRRRIRL